MRAGVRPRTRADARRMVAAWHSHHKAHLGETLSLGWWDGAQWTACAVAGRPTAPSLCDGETWEVTRCCIGPNAPSYASSRLLGAVGRSAEASGITRLVSYTRADERGTSYLASGWTPVAMVVADTHDHGNRKTRWLPGLYLPSTEIVDRVRWERGERSGLLGAIWIGGRWEGLWR